MSCYAFLKKWLLPSLLYDCFSKFSILPQSIQFETLFNNQGCYPLDFEPLHSESDSINFTNVFTGFLKLVRFETPRI